MLAMSPARPDVTRLLSDWKSGDASALDELAAAVYSELRRIADRYLRRERSDHTLQPTALVHEAFIRLVGQDASWQNRSHFFGVAAEIMRRILVDHARRKQAEKRGGEAEIIQLTDDVEDAAAASVDLVALDDALTRLAMIDPQQSRIVELRFFTGLSIEETAEALQVSPSTVKREWRMARAWLFRELKK